jgi:hypothetical protein
MAVEPLKALMEDLGLGHVSHLEQAADLPKDRIGVFLKDSREIVSMPKKSVMQDVARAFGCDLLSVVHRFAQHLELPWGDDKLSLDERLLLRRYREMPAASRRSLLLAAQAMNGGR